MTAPASRASGTAPADPLAWCTAGLEQLDAQGLRRHPLTNAGPAGPVVLVGGRPLVQFCSNDYLGLAGHPRLRQAAAEAAQHWGAGSGASRLVSGTASAHRDLERSLAELEGCADALVFSSGYLANLGTIPALVGRGDTVFSDALNHASIIDGCRLSGAQVVVYPHGEAGFLDQALARSGGGRRLVVTDTVFSMEGDLAPLGALHEVCERHGAMLMVDEAHATGVLGERGSGAVEAAGLTGRVGIVMGTLSKALGSAGGYVAGSTGLVEWLRNRARSYVFDTAPAPGAVAAAQEALTLVRAEPERRRRVLAMAGRLADELRSLGYQVAAPAAAIVPVLVGGAQEALELSARLAEQGVFIPAIRPPSVPEGTARLRVTVSAAHTDQHLATGLAAFRAARGASSRARARGPAPLPAPTATQASAPVPASAPAPAGLDPRILAAGGVFVTGTGTGVGKTVVAAALARGLRVAGWRVGALKPAQTGSAEGADDLGFVQAAAGLTAGNCRAPYRLEAPLAPSVSARLAGVCLEVGVVIEAFRVLRRECDLVVVEGSGGLAVPFNEAHTMADLARALGLPVLVVALAGLGTLNHCTLTVQAARSQGLDVLGLVLSRFPAHPGLAERTNPAELERSTGTNLLGAVPELAGLDVERGLTGPGWSGAEAGDSWLAPALAGRFDPDRFQRDLEVCLDPV